MSYSIDDLRTNVRALFQNQGPDVLPDEILDVPLLNGKRRLDRDYPREKSIRLDPQSAAYFNLSSLITDWKPFFSRVVKIANPAPDLTSREEISWAGHDLFRTVEMEGSWYLRFDDQIPTGRKLLVYYTIPWDIDGLDSATTSTITDGARNALEFICASMVAESLASKAAGQNQRQIAADIIDWNSKEASYRRMAKEWLTMYLRELGLDSDKPKPAASIRNMTPTMQDGFNWMTHRRTVR